MNLNPPGKEVPIRLPAMISLTPRSDRRQLFLLRAERFGYGEKGEFTRLL